VPRDAASCACVLAALSVVMLARRTARRAARHVAVLRRLRVDGRRDPRRARAIIVGVMAGMRTHRWGVALAAIGVAAVAMALPLLHRAAGDSFPADSRHHDGSRRPAGVR
jgi:hypothetical protein